MSLNVVSLAPITAYITSHLSSGWRSLRGQSRARPTPVSEDIWPTPPISYQASSTVPALVDYVEDVAPLTEAEVYVLFGRLQDAVAVLAAALEEERLSDEQVARFWIEQESRIAVQASR